MTPDEIRAAIETQIRAWQTGDAELLVGCFAPEGEIIVAGKCIRGHAALKATVARFASRHRDVRVTLHRIICGDDYAAVEYRWEDTKIETDERYVADDSVWVDFDAGLITRWREYVDNDTPKAEAQSDKS